MKFMIAKKIGMSQVYDENGTVTPVTVLEAGPLTVTQVKVQEKDGYTAVQVGFGTRKAKNVSKPVRGHVKELGSFAVLKEFRVNNEAFERGQQIHCDVFTVGDAVDVTGTSIGRGFAGVVKRHGFGGAKASHGNKDQLRMPGSVGAQAPQHVFKGTRMGGRMGGQTATVKNTEIIAVDPTTNQLKIKGAVPGATRGIVYIKTAKNARKATAPKEKQEKKKK